MLHSIHHTAHHSASTAPAHARVLSLPLSLLSLSLPLSFSLAVCVRVFLAGTHIPGLLPPDPLRVSLDLSLFSVALFCLNQCF